MNYLKVSWECGSLPAPGPPLGASFDNGMVSSDPLSYRDHWRVREYEVDGFGHVNNAVYLNWAEEMAARHAEASGLGQEWAAQHQGGWVVRHTEITYFAPARFGDELELAVQVELVRGTRAHRRTTIDRGRDGLRLAEVFTEWVWVRLSDHRPAPVPKELVALAAERTAATLAGQTAHRAGRR